MTYEKAKQCFDENIRAIADPDSDFHRWNLYSGLLALTNAVQTDLHDLHSQVQDLAHALQRLEGAVRRR